MQVISSFSMIIGGSKKFNIEKRPLKEIWPIKAQMTEAKMIKAKMTKAKTTKIKMTESKIIEGRSLKKRQSKRRLLYQR